VNVYRSAVARPRAVTSPSPRCQSLVCRTAAATALGPKVVGADHEASIAEFQRPLLMKSQGTHRRPVVAELGLIGAGRAPAWSEFPELTRSGLTSVVKQPFKSALREVNCF
jgi:hypothetical protein